MVLFTICLFLIDGLIWLCFPNFYDGFDTYLQREVGEDSIFYDSSIVYLCYVEKAFEYCLNQAFSVPEKMEYKILNLDETHRT